jgi:hypothetical protein
VGRVRLNILRFDEDELLYNFVNNNKLRQSKRSAVRFSLRRKRGERGNLKSSQPPVFGGFWGQTSTQNGRPLSKYGRLQFFVKRLRLRSSFRQSAKIVVSRLFIFKNLSQLFILRAQNKELWNFFRHKAQVFGQKAQV